jgi:hypothetical protein
VHPEDGKISCFKYPLHATPERKSSGVSRGRPR